MARVSIFDMEQMEDFKQGPEEIEKNVREHIEIRFEWAKALSKMFRESDFTDALARDTDLYARIFGKRVSFLEAQKDERWSDLIRDIRSSKDPAATCVEYWKRFSQARREKPREFFGPFRFDYHAEEHRVSIHFGSMGWSREERDAPVRFTKDTKEELARLFRTVRERHPDAKVVSGSSWLFTELFASPLLSKKVKEVLPPSFVESRHTTEYPSQGGGYWGQFVDNRGRVHRGRAAEFRERMHNSEIMKPDTFMQAFPVQPTYLEAPVEDFYRFYEVE